MYKTFIYIFCFHLMSGVLNFSKPPIILGEIWGPIKSCSSAFLFSTMKNNFFLPLVVM